jgi:hypothetical protein
MRVVESLIRTFYWDEGSSARKIGLALGRPDQGLLYKGKGELSRSSPSCNRAPSDMRPGCQGGSKTT